MTQYDDFSPGERLGAGSLNDSISSRMVFATLTTSAGGITSGAFPGGNGMDLYITSGMLPTNNRICVNATYGIGSSTDVSNVWIAVGPSGSSPSLTIIGSANLTSSAFDHIGYMSIWAVGSTTIDSSTPAMVRMGARIKNGITASVVSASAFGVR